MAKVRRTRKKTEVVPCDSDENNIIHMCTDVYPPTDELDFFRQLAVAEDPTNVIPGLSQCPTSGTLIAPRIAVVTGKKWANGRVLRVGFMGGTSAQQEFVGKTADQWSQHCTITFQWGVALAQSDIRVAFDRNEGAFSYMGSDNSGIPKNRKTMNLGWLDVAVVLHEFGHALACIHEHQHPTAAIPWNTQAVYRYYGGPPNHWDRQTIDNNIFAKYAVGQTQHSEYDGRSIMHYAIAAQLLTDPSRAVGWNNTLSARDTEFIGQIYPRSTPPPPPPPPAGALEITLSGRPEPGTYALVRK